MNYIKTLDASVLNDLTNLEELELRYNRLEELPVGLFAKTKNLKEISLDYNLLKSIDTYPTQCLERFTVEGNTNPKIDTRMIKICQYGHNNAVALNAASGALVGCSAIVLARQYF